MGKILNKKALIKIAIKKAFINSNKLFSSKDMEYYSRIWKDVSKANKKKNNKLR